MLNGIASDQLSTSHGVRQGSIMESTLFLLNVDDLFKLSSRELRDSQREMMLHSLRIVR